MECRFNVASDKLSTQSRSFHDVHGPEEARETVYLRQRRTPVISLSYTEPCQIPFQERTSLSCEHCRLEPFRCDLGSSLFPGGDYSINPLETLNILGYVEPLVHQRNGAFHIAMVGFSLLPQSLYVQVATLLEHNKNVQVKPVIRSFPFRRPERFISPAFPSSGKFNRY
jgi:hypothetical protein